MLRLLVATIVLLLSVSFAQAASCSVTIGDLDFGPVDTIGNVAATSDTEVTIDCDGASEGTETITLCGHIGAGSGGSSNNLRQSLSPAGTLDFALFASAGGAIPWGSAAAPELGEPRRITVDIHDGAGSAFIQLHGIVPNNQQAAAVGNYRADLTTSDVSFDYGEGSLDCSAPLESSTTASFAVTASVAANCLLETSDLDFGTSGLIGDNIDAETDLNLTCTSGTGYSIAISGGGAGDPNNRLLSSGGNSVRYGLYSDSQRTNVWGTAEGSIVSDEGSGAERKYWVYGRIPPQPAAAGAYGDTVVVTITY